MWLRSRGLCFFHTFFFYPLDFFSSFIYLSLRRLVCSLLVFLMVIFLMHSFSLFWVFPLSLLPSPPPTPLSLPGPKNNNNKNISDGIYAEFFPLVVLSASAVPSRQSRVQARVERYPPTSRSVITPFKRSLRYLPLAC